MRPLPQIMAVKECDLAQLIERTGLDKKKVTAIVNGNYTASPQQRQRIAEALGVSVDDVSWNHGVSVDHMYGHGPQFGRTP